jgi:hypothetical protein
LIEPCLGNIGGNLDLGLAFAILQTEIQPDEPNGFAPRIRTGDLIQSQLRLNILPQK